MASRARSAASWVPRYCADWTSIPAPRQRFSHCSFTHFLLLFTLFSLKVVNVPLTALTVLGGALALGVGFGSQNIINNFISGLILHAERPVKVGDLIQLDDLYGNVEHIGARSTRVRTGSNLEIIVPNSTFLQNNVINFHLVERQGKNDGRSGSCLRFPGGDGDPIAETSSRRDGPCLQGSAADHPCSKSLGTIHSCLKSTSGFGCEP